MKIEPHDSTGTPGCPAFTVIAETPEERALLKAFSEWGRENEALFTLHGRESNLSLNGHTKLFFGWGPRGSGKHEPTKREAQWKARYESERRALDASNERYWALVKALKELAKAQDE